MSSIAKKVIIFGAHGKVGQQVIRQISKISSYSATAVVRDQRQTKNITDISSNNSNVSTKILTVDSSSVEEISEAIKGHDAVVFTAGSGGKDLLKVDLDGAVKTFEASHLANVRRFVIISAIHADNREFFETVSLRNYYIAKHYADRILISEFKDKLDFTILKPSLLTDDEATGKIRLIKDVSEETGHITRADVAKVILEVIGNKKTYGKSYNFANGNLDISNPQTFD